MSTKQESASGWLGKRMAGARGYYVAASLFTLLSAGCFVIFSLYLSEFAASWLDNGLIVTETLLIAALFLAGRYIFAHLESRFNYNAGNSIVAEIKKELFPVLLHDSKLNSTDSALYVTKISDDLRPYFAFFVPYSIATAVVSILLLVICFIVEKWVALILMISLLVIPIQMAVIGIGAEAIHKKHTQLFLKYSAVFYNRLKTIAETVNLSNFNTQYKFLSRKSEELNNATTNVMKVAILSSAVLELFVTIAIAAIAIYLGMSLMGIMNGPNYGKGYDFGTALFLLTITPYFFFYIRKFVSAYHDRNRALAAAELLMPLLERESEPEVTDKNEPYHNLNISKISFTYPDSPVKVLHNIHQHFPEKGVVLVKGISGSGKSTLLKICAGSLSVKEGDISVNGKDNLWSEQWLKENTSYMNQFPFIFDGSLRYNVFLKKEAEEGVEYPDFLNRILEKKEDGWDTELSHNGVQLSGGERQLLTLARMMLHPKPVAILDEPTSNLDSETTEVIISEIVKMAEERLVIVASHEQRFESVADNIVNLNWGEQTEYA
ncbi:MAG: ATP-binding cassette domain-containing protein [Fermentimonas sp.]|nr:ATP-binding cassette domain-containing protein [Fermentimonas sp.]